MFANRLTAFVVAAFCALPLSAYASPHHARNAGCQPMRTTFSSASDISEGGNTPFIMKTDSDSYALTSEGLELYLRKPDGPVTATKGVNDKLGLNSAVNSTFELSYGKVSYEVSAPVGRGRGGIITAIILMGDSHDEIDIELLSGDPSHWQTNAFAPAESDTQPLYGVQSSIEEVPRCKNYWETPSIGERHIYTIDWNAERIVWGIDGKDVRTLTAKDAVIDGISRYPVKPMRVQMGVWDGSSPEGTSEWALGPVNWRQQPERLTATIHSVTIECPSN
ncbi:hypothetical protein ONZ45_g14899 [Pleurotus djamor]|nr:hypothetical protein ONZ45_g14899 [Pleurotus djamor]